MLTATTFIDFLADLLRDFRGSIDLVLDRHPAHCAKSVMRFLAQRGHRIRVHFLPGYAPELNPDEHVWAYLKGLFRSDPLLEGEAIQDAVADAMDAISEDKSLVRSFFDHPKVAYVKGALRW